ncbi:MAG: AgmX/PglI C-terminal domain-containing protein [Polyangiaceae bacterium]|nr:AgmX/PglI C-terminal domain-containing protein [Polyangiaceae bacterium]
MLRSVSKSVSIAAIALCACVTAYVTACGGSTAATADPGGAPTPNGESTPSNAATPTDNPSAPDNPQSPNPTNPNPPAPGTVTTPPGSASAWNTGQSDGKPGTTDRGVDDYRRIIDADRAKFRSCYDAARAKQSGIQGTVTLVWVLDPAGAVRDGAHIDEAASSFKTAELEKCMVDALKSLTFPPSTRGLDSTVRYPFGFKP